MTTQLFPSTKFKERTAALESRFSIKEYVDCFLSAANPVEQAHLFKCVSIQNNVNDLIAKSEDALDRLKTAWDVLETFAELIVRIDPAEVVWNKKILAEEKEKRKNKQKLSPELQAGLDAGNAVLEMESSKEQELISKGYGHLPPRPQSTLLITRFEESVTKELGFNLFGEFNQHLVDLEKALPRSKEGNRGKVSASPTIRLILFKQWTDLNKTFNTHWADSVQQIAAALDCPESEDVLHKIRVLGACIAEWNRRAGGIALFGSKVSDHLKFEDQISAHSVKRELPQQRLGGKEAANKLPEVATDFISKMTEAFKIPDAIDNYSGVLAIAEFKYMTWLFSDFTTSPLGGLFFVSPLLVPSMRDILLDLLRRSNQEELGLLHAPTFNEIEQSGFLPLCFLCYSPSRTDELDIESLFLKIELEQRPISDPIFFDVISSRFEDCWFETPEDILQDGINRLNHILREQLQADEYPEDFDSIYMLGVRLGFPAPRIGRELSNETDICGLFLLAAILNEDKYDYGDYQYRSDEYLQCATALLDDGLVETAGFIFCYYLVTEVWEVITLHTTKLREDPNSTLQQCLHPIGNWRKICDIASRLSSLGWGGRIQRTFALCGEYLKINEIDQLRFSVSQLRSLSGFYEISDEGKEAAKTGLKVVEQQSSHLRGRLIDVMGGDSWKKLSTEMQQTLVRFERKYETGLGDASAYGGREPTWALDWANLVEGMLKEQLQILWDPNISNHSANCLLAVGRETLKRHFEASTAVFICQGAAKIGDTIILERLKHTGVDPHSIGGTLGKNLVALFGKRNKITHPIRAVEPEGEQSIKQLEAEKIRIWVIKNIAQVIDNIGLKKQYFTNN